MNELKPLEFKNQRILTTEQLAEVYKCTTTHIKQNFNNHKDNFINGKHYFFLEGAELKAFKNQVDSIDLVDKHTASLYLWTERGANRHCKILDTNKAWEQFDNLEETYFNVKQTSVLSNTNELSPLLQVLINLELKQKDFEVKLDEATIKNEQTSKKLDNIREIVALNPTQWRKDTSALINKIALKCGGYEHIKIIRDESYKLLEQRYGVQLNTRLTNKKKTLALRGACKSRIDKVNQVDVIADDKKLIEGFVSIIKEMSIKYGIDAVFA